MSDKTIGNWSFFLMFPSGWFILGPFLDYFSISYDVYSWIWFVKWISSFFVAALLVAIFIQPFYRDRNKICCWCKSKKLSFISGKEGNWFWEYRNKDGSQDKRVKDNFQRASYYSEYECLKCGAITYFQHYVNKNPSNKVNVWKRKLLKKGEGERTGIDTWDQEGSIDLNSANRKN